MSDLSLTLTIAEQRVLSGQRVSVRVELLNTGAEPLLVQAPYGVLAPPLFFTFRNSPEGDVVYELSRGLLDTAMLGDDTPMVVEPDLVEMQPGASRTTEDDLGELTLGPIAPGRYQVRAEWRQPDLFAESEFVELWVLAPEVTVFAPLVCVHSAEVVGLLGHHTDSGTVLLERRVTTPAPHLANLAPRHFVPAPGNVSDVAIAVHLGDGIRGRWHAWLRDEELWAAHSWGDALMAKPAPLRVHLKGARLARPAFHSTSGRGLVVAFGQTPTGPVLQRFEFEPKRLREGPLVSLKVNGSRLNDEMPPDVRLRALSERGRIAVFWSQGVAASTCIYGCVLDEKGRLTDGPTILYTSELPTLAWDVDPIGKWSDAELHLALGPDRRGTVHYVTVGVGDSTHLAQHTAVARYQRTLPRVIGRDASVVDSAPPPDDEVAPQWLSVDAAVVSGAPRRDPVLFLRCGETLLVARESRTGWDVLRRLPQRDASHLHVCAYGERSWAGWCEQGLGVVYTQL